MAECPITETASPPGQDAFRRLHNPIHSERHMRIICIGAGASGLLMAYKLNKHFENFRLTLYEKNPAVGGTWYENRYPGCACDVPSHNYTWSFEPKLDWTSVYPPAQEIFEYHEGFARKYNLYPHIRLRHQVVGARWDDEQCVWKVEVQDTTTTAAAAQRIHDECDILINAGGILNHWKWPDISGLDTFRGPVLHTARWDEGVQLAGKRVGIIGNGSSALQALPAIRAAGARITTFVRQATWVAPAAGLRQRAFGDAERAAFGAAGALLAQRKAVEAGFNARFGLYLRGHPDHAATQAALAAQMRAKLGGAAAGTELARRLVPAWSAACRRFSPGVGYLEALAAPDVRVVFGGVTALTPRGAVAVGGDGHETEYPLDVVVCATGFDTSFAPRFPLVGRGGADLREAWRAAPAAAYLGLAVPGFPNYLTLLGPNSPVGNGPVLAGVEAQADWVCRALDRWQTTNVAAFAPKAAAVDEFARWRDWFMRRTVWTDACRSWYKDGATGQVTGVWPGSTLHYLECVREVRWEDFDVRYAGGNRFAWLGNGFSQTELDDSADWAFYIREYDDDPPLSTAGRRRLLSKSGTVTDRQIVDYAGGQAAQEDEKEKEEEKEVKVPMQAARL
ncbi:hypothetical protein F4780DRAFT_773363 [Xylariomycetidae sp. FL0641]|nr:hypothetical protein F4780DRAFT_773363 [Xylariomycetidae sp. FL0641]